MLQNSIQVGGLFAMYFEGMGPWMGQIITIRTFDGKYLRELALEERTGDETLLATWIDKDGAFSSKYVLVDRTFKTNSVIAGVTAPSRNGPWKFPPNWYEDLEKEWSRRTSKPPATPHPPSIAAQKLRPSLPLTFTGSGRPVKKNRDKDFEYPKYTSCKGLWSSDTRRTALYSSFVVSISIVKLPLSCFRS